ncbi:MAG: hypothetical protein WCQ26_01210 [Pseudanabaena sp. ELA748]
MWLIVIGERRGELSPLEAHHAYRQRFDLEHTFRFGKQNLLLTAFVTPDVEHEQQWVKFVMSNYICRSSIFCFNFLQSPINYHLGFYTVAIAYASEVI